MGKVTFKPGTMVNPVPVVMISCGETEAEQNITTIAWTGIVNSEPPMTYISVRKSRHSHDIIEKRREFVINLCTEELTSQTDFCGVKSGRDVNKFKEQKLTPVPAQVVKCPMIQESPVNIECKVKEVHHYPSHDMFVAEIVAVHADDSLMSEKGKLELDRANLICFNHGDYYGIKKEPIGKFGFSVMKPKTKKRIDGEIRKENRKARSSAGAASGSRPAGSPGTGRSTGSYENRTAGARDHAGSTNRSASSYGNKSTESGTKTGSTWNKAGSTGSKPAYAKTGNTGSTGSKPAYAKTGSTGSKPSYGKTGGSGAGNAGTGAGRPARKPAAPSRNK
jgi:flavin reductase (DIM6/NTAB) family NADH-FMN oxidoreductase RutF